MPRDDPDRLWSACSAPNAYERSTVLCQGDEKKRIMMKGFLRKRESVPASAIEHCWKRMEHLGKAAGKSQGRMGKEYMKKFKKELSERRGR